MSYTDDGACVNYVLQMKGNYNFKWNLTCFE